MRLINGKITLLKLLEICYMLPSLPTTFWVEAISTTCYIQNWVLFSTNPKRHMNYGHNINPKLIIYKLFNLHVMSTFPSKNEASEL
jgi:hypothetical protein